MPDNKLECAESKSAFTVFVIFLRLGLTSFGGPVAHLGFFREEFVIRRRWLSERCYADLVALCQFLPGPASSQVGIALGLSRAGYPGALAAWAGFTLPSAIALILFAMGIASYSEVIPVGVLQGLQIAAVAVVAQAVWGMGKNFCIDVARLSIMAAAACFVLLVPSVFAQVGVMLMAGLIGLVVFKPEHVFVHAPLLIRVRRWVGLFWLMVFFTLLIVLPLLAAHYSNQTLALIDTFFRAGSLVFGGGHVVLPLLQAEVIPAGWVSNDTFLAGYAAAQAVPGPLFSFAAFLGGSITGVSGGWLAGMVCLLAIFAPSFLLVIGVLPFWESLRANARTQAALAGINAAVVGLLLAALYQLVCSSAIEHAQDFGLALLAFIALMFWKMPAWLVVLGSGVAGGLLAL